MPIAFANWTNRRSKLRQSVVKVLSFYFRNDGLVAIDLNYQVRRWALGHLEDLARDWVVIGNNLVPFSAVVTDHFILAEKRLILDLEMMLCLRQLMSVRRFRHGGSIRDRLDQWS
jgi:hypothetical protein